MADNEVIVGATIFFPVMIVSTLTNFVAGGKKRNDDDLIDFTNLFTSRARLITFRDDSLIHKCNCKQKQTRHAIKIINKFQLLRRFSTNKKIMFLSILRFLNVPSLNIRIPIKCTDLY